MYSYYKKSLKTMAILLLPILIAVGIGSYPSHSQTLNPCDVKIPSVVKPELVLQRSIKAGANLVYLTHAGDGSRRKFLVKQPGRIQIAKGGEELLTTPFLDIRDRVSFGGERGLLSVAFHPDYKNNGRFFVDYTRKPDDATVVAEYHVSSNPDIADPNSERVILIVPQPFDTHKGGQLQFGPDGMLYIALGDGGGKGDPMGNAQNLGTLLGDLLRIDVDHGSPYVIPSDNPFVSAAGAQGEIWASGFRNPWRFSFDRCGGRLWLSDVGQESFEEIDLLEKGSNYGWSVMEGIHCYQPTEGCNQNGLQLPIAEYSHDVGCAIVGGYVYRGTKYPALVGHYLFGDFCTGKIWSLILTDTGDWTMTELLDADIRISSFGEDERGELYVLDLPSGKAYHITVKSN
ncbi:MAG: hypothetical protein A2Z21_04555 [Candidatus Fraserbacteria bacterium RBG_16_55_9]|uniref:Glucose/Sorbosone dehydrogenase domain-containing protein n=1 Tax=Fraserbacteria sp. (strain RBG_16_55_9) TaxID=1817864 RepID=A0A1F5UV79_FRAXR|nr:MAG: hypothetical protein A2Z21_04555 [Candidatus Fraserbacteria bacterium RBG_16_55_9]